MGFSVARAKLKMSASQLEFDSDQQVIPSTQLTFSLSEQCYDIYTSNYRPWVWVKHVSQYVLVVYPGPCSRVILVGGISNASNPLKKSPVQKLFPVRDTNSYVASAAFDWKNELIWLATKHYEQGNVQLVCVKSAGGQLQLVGQWDMERFVAEADPILTIAYDPDGFNPKLTVATLLLAASGFDNVFRYSYAPTGGAPSYLSGAALSLNWNKVSATLYHSPYFYFATYEPNAKIVRIPRTSFCAPASGPCGGHSYCAGGACVCESGWTYDGISKDARGVLRCVPGFIADVERKVEQTSGATGALATLLAFSIVAGIVGWVLWWRARKSSYAAL